MVKGSLSALLLFFLLVPPFSESAWAKLVIHSQTEVEIVLISYDGLSDSTLFKGSISAAKKAEIDTLYQGLALLNFKGGQSYPVIIGEEPFVLTITSPTIPPSFTIGSENEFFYRLISGENPDTNQYNFARLMVQAKKMLDSSRDVHTVEELISKKKEFHRFVGKNYQSLKNSDMIRQLIAQYFMMHEYIDYHIEGSPAGNIRMRYQQEVFSGVGSWISLLKGDIAEHEILNYCVSLYYNRSMVSLASLIIERFKDFAYCNGDEKTIFSFGDDLIISEGNGVRDRQLGDFKMKKIIGFVSDDCPVSMVKTVTMARRLVEKKEGVVMIVAPLQKLSTRHLAMHRLVSGGNMFFLNDEKWRKENLSNKIKLPLSIELRTDL